jgi:hypothetical protein
METKSAPAPNPFTNPYPKQLFCSDVKACDAHRALIQSEAWQVASRAAQAQMTRSILSISGGKLDDANHTQAAAFAFERLQGMNDFVNIFTDLATVPPPPVLRKDLAALEGE